MIALSFCEIKKDLDTIRMSFFQLEIVDFFSSNKHLGLKCLVYYLTHQIKTS